MPKRCRGLRRAPGAEGLKRMPGLLTPACRGAWALGPWPEAEVPPAPLAPSAASGLLCAAGLLHMQFCIHLGLAS